jgi:hypothetical protein
MASNMSDKRRGRIVRHLWFMRLCRVFRPSEFILGNQDVLASYFYGH